MNENSDNEVSLNPISDEALTDQLALSLKDDDEGIRKAKIKAFKSICFKTGLSVTVMLALRIAFTVVISILGDSLSNLPYMTAYLIQTGLSLVFIYALPMLFLILIFKKDKPTEKIGFYKKPRYLGSAVGFFPTIYGTAFIVNVITMLVVWLSTRGNDINESFNTVNDFAPDNLPAALILLFQLVVIAPIFEEIWFRGILMRKLYPYGSGFAIITSALVFGVAHGNVQQFFYTTIIGIFLGYIAYATGSIIATTILHALVNSISGGLIVIMTLPGVKDYLQNNGSFGIFGATDPSVITYAYYIVFMFLLGFTGVISLIIKLTKAKRYKTPSIMTEISLGKKFGIYFTSIMVIISIFFVVEVFLDMPFTHFIFKPLL